MNMCLFRCRTVSILILLLVLLLTVLLAVPARAQEQNAGVVDGTVLNETTGQPLVGISVTLSAFTTEGLQAELSASTDETGAFVFTDLDTSDGIVYAASVSYRGVLYSTGMIQFQETVEQTADITVFETTTDRSVLSIASRGLVLSELDPDAGRLVMLDITSLAVDGNQTFVAGDTGRSVEFPIPRNAGAPALLPGFDFGTAVVENSVVYASSALRPGGGSATLSYPVQYTGTGVALDVLSPYPTEVFRVLIPADFTANANSITVSGTGLEDEGIVNIGERDYHVWSATDLRQGGTTRVRFGSLPESGFAPNRLRVAEPTILAGLALVAATAVTAVAVKRKQVVSMEPGLDESITAGFVESREELVLQLQELQDEHEHGIIDEELYLSERRFLLERLRVVSRHLRETPPDTAE